MLVGSCSVHMKHCPTLKPLPPGLHTAPEPDRAGLTGSEGAAGREAWGEHDRFTPHTPPSETGTGPRQVWAGRGAPQCACAAPLAPAQPPRRASRAARGAGSPHTKAQGWENGGDGGGSGGHGKRRRQNGGTGGGRGYGGGTATT